MQPVDSDDELDEMYDDNSNNGMECEVKAYYPITRIENRLKRCHYYFNCILYFQANAIEQERVPYCCVIAKAKNVIEKLGEKMDILRRNKVCSMLKKSSRIKLFFPVSQITQGYIETLTDSGVST